MFKSVLLAAAALAIVTAPASAGASARSKQIVAKYYGGGTKAASKSKVSGAEAAANQSDAKFSKAKTDKLYRTKCAINKMLGYTSRCDGL